MIISKITAGLCNQMYFFSTAYALAKEWNEDFVIDLDKDGNLEWMYLLGEFNLPHHKKITYPLRYHITEDFVKIPSELRKKVTVIDEKYFEEDGEYLTIPKEKFWKEFPGKEIYLKGTFLARQMFTKYLPDLRKIFTLKKPSELVAAFEKASENFTAIGVHIRRQGFAVLGDHNGIDFFKAAIVHMRQLYENARFYIFSDEPDYVKEHLGTASDIFYIDAMNGFRGDVEEFMCLTKCHHYILTRRSTYGRMAEILNDCQDKVSVLYGKNTWNDSEERFHFLEDEEIERLSKRFEYQGIKYDFDINLLNKLSEDALKQEFINISLDSERITAESRRKILCKKAEAYANNGNYKQAIHLCTLLEEQYGENSIAFHKFYGDVLYSGGKSREALVEYIYASKSLEIENRIFETEPYAEYKKLLEKGADGNRKHYIIAQYGNYTSQYLSQMQMLGIILARMGNEVSFILKKNMPSWEENVSNNDVMINWACTVDNKWFDMILEKGFSIGRLFYGYPCYDFADIISDKKEKLLEISEKYSHLETVLIGREPEIMTIDIPFRKVFVDFSAPFDEAYLKEAVGEADMNKMYECADIIVTRKNVYQNDDKQVLYIDESLLEAPEYNVEKQILYNDLTMYTEDYLDIALRIALAAESCNR